jgi:hypothetical protein
MALRDTKESANRLARVMASDIAMYNEKKIVEGIEKDTFWDVLADDLHEYRAQYKSQIKPEVDPDCWLFDRAIVDVILARKGNIKSKIW